jgi:hypothetical protein
MLKMSVREKIQSLILHPSIYSVAITDFRIPSGSRENLATIHVNTGVNRKEVFELLDSIGIETRPKEPHLPAYGTQAFPYELIIEGAYPLMSTIFFTERVKEIAPASTEAVLENVYPEYTTFHDNSETWSSEEAMLEEERNDV